MIHSLFPFLSKSFTNMVNGLAGVALNFVFSPQLPKTKSWSPSLSRSAASILFHHPLLFGIIFWLSNVPFSL